jgi:hypothetical protein
VTIAFGARVEAHPHRPRVLKHRAGGSDLTVSVRVIPRGHVQYASLLVLTDVTFDVQPAGPKRVREVTGVRDVHAFVRGTNVLAMFEEGDSRHFDPGMITGERCLVSYNPFKADHFYEVLPNSDGTHEAGRQVIAAEAVVMRGGDCYAINPTFA